MPTYDDWKSTEPRDPWAEEVEQAERELADDMAEHPERYGLPSSPSDLFPVPFPMPEWEPGDEVRRLQ